MTYKPKDIAEAWASHQHVEYAKHGSPGAEMDVDEYESRKRGWIHRRMVELYTERFKVSGRIEQAKWAECYKEAAAEFDGLEKLSGGKG